MTKQKRLTNLTDKPLQVKIKTPQGADYIHVMPKKKVTLASDYTVDPNWLVMHQKLVKIEEA